MEMTPIRPDDPLWIAWLEYKQTEEFANSLRWATVGGDATIGSMWTMFCAGWNARASLPELPSPVEAETCEWTEDDDANWWTACDNGFVFFDGGPMDNDMKFCPYCGKPITIKLERE